MQANEKLKELESALVNLAENVVNADGRKEFSLCISKDGGVEDYGEAAWVHCQLGTVYVCVPRNHAVADARHYYGQGMEFANRVTVRSDIDFDATIKSVNDLRDAFNKNSRESLVKRQADKLAEERKNLIERLAAIDKTQPVTH